MREIHLNSKYSIVTMVDDEDELKFAKYKWYGSNGYADGKIDGKRVSLHRVIMNAQPGQEVDHIDGIKLNNQKSNLRFCTRSQNAINKNISKNNSSGFKGVSWNKNRKYFESYITVNYKRKHLGVFHSAIEASEAYKKACEENFGEFAFHNREAI